MLTVNIELNNPVSLYNQQVFGTLCVFSEKAAGLEGGWRAKVTVYSERKKVQKVREVRVRCFSFHSLATSTVFFELTQYFLPLCLFAKKIVSRFQLVAEFY